jgi:hypothetical protein
MMRLSVVTIAVVAIIAITVLSLSSSSSSSLLPEAEASSVECWEIGPNSNTEDTPSYYRYTYYYRKQCNYYNVDNNQLYQYWYTVTSIREYRSKTSSYYDRDYYYTTQTWTLVNSDV